MKRVCAVLLSAVAVFALAACGGGNNATNTKGNDHDHDHEDGHGHGDEHGKAHALGEKKVGDYVLQVAQVESDSTTEAVFEVKVMKDGKSVKDVPVDVWLGDAAGIELSPIVRGEWMEKEQLFDCHALKPKDMNDARLWVRIRPADAKLDPVDFELDKD